MTLHFLTESSGVGVMGKGSISNSDAGSSVLDRSCVRILLCDKDPTNSQQLLELLRKCSYQVTAVSTAREVVSVLNTEGREIDLILAEVDLPKSKGFKMLKYITRSTCLQRIPIVMMSAQDEVAVVMKCLKLGAADYLVKPLRINELLNLWMHMWRRRRMLGLADKNIISKNLGHDLDMLVSDLSDSNTNSTNLFSDDTNDKKVRSHAGPEISTQVTPSECELQSHESPKLELSLKRSSEGPPEEPEPGSLAGKFLSYPKRSELKFGAASAFLTYVNASVQANRTPNQISVGENKASQQETAIPEKHGVMGPPSTDNRPIGLSHSSEAVKSSNRTEFIPCEEHSRDRLETRSCNVSMSPEIPIGQVAPAGEQFPMVQGGLPNEGSGMNNHDISSLPAPHFLPGMMNHSMSASMHLCHGVHHDVGSRGAPRLIPFHTFQPCHGMPVNATMPYYPYGFVVAPATIGSSHAWPGMANLSVSEPKITQVERREAALNKFRQKRKDRCFDKKIRYVSRKRLAEQRPRIRGQFVRQTNDMEAAGANGVVYGVDSSEDEDDGYVHGSGELRLTSSPESLAGDTENAI